MNLLERILSCSEEEVDKIITEAINEANSTATKIGNLGFLNGKNAVSSFKGFIPLDTRIKYGSNNMEDYGMETTDFFYEYAKFIRKYNIDSKSKLIFSLEHFINDYFGYSGKVDRDYIFDTVAFQTTTTDEEYFEALKNNKIGDLKGRGAAECTERGALVSQILSLFGTEVYYSIGCVDLGDRQEAHCFNIVKRANDYAILDYSVPVASFNPDGSVKEYYPFVGNLSNEEFLDFINNGMVKSFDDYYMDGSKMIPEDGKRMYVVGSYQINKENTM